MNLDANGINEVINNLALKLGVPVEQIFQYYQMKAYSEWSSVFVFVVGAFIIYHAIYKLFSLVSGDDDEREIVRVVLIVAMTFFGSFHFDTAIKATIAPEAYAISSIMDNF